MGFSENIKIRKSYIIILSLMLPTISMLVPIGMVSADVEVINLTISGDTQYLFETFNIKGELVIDENATVAFYGCTFNFIVETQVPRITLRKNSSVIFSHCVFFGLSNNSAGSGFIRGINIRSVRFNDCVFRGMGAQENQRTIINILGDYFANAPVEFTGNRIYYTDWGIANITNCANITFSDNIINGPAVQKSYYDWAVFFIGCTNITIVNNTFSGIYSDVLRFSTIYGYVRIDNNTIRANGNYGIYGEFIEADLFVKNNVFDNITNGIYLYKTNLTLILNNTLNFDSYGIIINNPPGQSCLNISILSNRFITKSDSIEGYIRLGSVRNITIDYNNFTLPQEENLWGQLILVSSFDYYYSPYVYVDVNSTGNNYIGNRRFYIISHLDLGGGDLDTTTYPDAGGFWFVDVKNGRILLSPYLSVSASFSNCRNLVVSGYSGGNGPSGITVSGCTDVTFENIFINNSTIISGNLISIENSTDITLYNLQVGFQKPSSATTVYVYSVLGFRVENSIFIGDLFSHIRLRNVNNTGIVGNRFEVDSGSVISLSETNNVTLQSNDFFVKDLSVSREYEIDFDENAFNGFINITGNHWTGNINVTDSDRDGIADEPYSITVGGYTLTDPFPIFVDYDKDGLDTNQEYHFGTDPWIVDTDHDGISDYDEIRIYYTDAKKFDTDNDGLNDSEEVFPGKDGFITDPFKVDTDGDGISDYLEFMVGTDPTDPNSFPGGIVDQNSTEYIGGSEPDPVNTNTISGYGMILPIIGCSTVVIALYLYIRCGKNNKIKIYKGGCR